MDWQQDNTILHVGFQNNPYYMEVVTIPVCITTLEFVMHSTTL